MTNNLCLTKLTKIAQENEKQNEEVVEHHGSG